MKEYQEFLKDKYYSLELSLPREMLDCYSTEYINLTLTRKKESDDSHFMFQEDINDNNVPLTEALNVENYKKKVVLILGGPGMGKSTLAINICKQWANSELLQGYDAVILLQLQFKKIQKAKDIKELLLTPNDELKEKVYSEIAKSNGKKICFILEGYDELPYDLQRSSVFTELTEELIKCTVICTSRPKAYSPLFTNAIKVIKINGFSKESVDRYISKALDDEMRENVYKEIARSDGENICFFLVGYDELLHHLQWSSIFVKLIEKLPKCTVVFTSCPEESVDKYISKAFEQSKNGKEMAQKLKLQIQNNSVVESILHIPINVAIVCLIFFHFSTLPETLTELYTLLCLRLILRHIITRTPNNEQIENLHSLDDLPTGIHEQFLQLCYIACKGMQTAKVIFSSQDLVKFQVKDDNLNGMGLLEIAPTISVAGREKS